MTKNRVLILKYFYFLVIVLSCVPVLFYSYVFLKYTTNAPYYDDFYWGFSFLQEYNSAQTLSEKLSLIFQQHSQHRIAYFRSFMVGYYHLFGQINFKSLAIFGNVSNLVAFFVIAFQIRNDKNLKYFILPFALIFFQIQYYQNIISTYGFPNNAVIMWSILVFYALTKPQTKWFIFTLIAIFFSIFSNGNGFLCFPIVIYFLFLQKRYFHLKIVSIIFAIFSIFYFVTFEKSEGEIMFSTQTISYFFKFLTAAFYTGRNKIELLVAVLIVAFFVVQFFWDSYLHYFKNKEIKNLSVWIFTSATIGWIIATALSVAIYRANRNISIPNWYFNYSILLIIFSSIFLVLYLKNSKLKIAFFIFLTAYGITNYLKNIQNILPTIQVFQSNLEADVINFENHKKWSFLLTQVGYPKFKEFQKLTDQFYDRGIYKPSPALPSLSIYPKESELHKCTITRSYSAHGESIINIDLLKTSAEKNNIKTRFGFIKSAEEVYFFGVVNPINNSKNDMILNGRLFGEESYFIIPPKFFDIAIKKGEYQIGIVYIDNQNQAKWYISDEKHQIENY